MFSRVLAAIDEEGHAEHAVNAAAEIAVRFNCPLVLLTVLGQAGLTEELEELAHDEGLYVGEITQRILDEAAATARRMGVTDIVRLDEEGDPVEIILNAARANNADLIVMGAHTIKPHEDLIHTSVSHQVMARAACPCLIVR